MRLIFYFLFASFIAGCVSEEEPDPVRVGYSYFPLELGSYIDYQVTEEVYIASGSVTTENYLLRSQIVDSFPNDAGSTTYIIHRFRKATEEDSWEFSETWSARRDEIKGVTVEGNIPYQSLSFPVRNGLRWDGNNLNAEFPDTYTLENLGTEYIIPDVATGSSLTVVQEDLLDLIIEKEDTRYEIYMQDIGLVEKVIRELNLCTGNGCPGGIESGKIFVQKAIGYGMD
jgi:hypothetical protein